MKTPYQKLTSFHEIPKYVENYNPPQEILDKLMNYASKIKSCHKNPKKPWFNIYWNEYQKDYYK